MLQHEEAAGRWGVSFGSGVGQFQVEGRAVVSSDAAAIVCGGPLPKTFLHNKA